ncbi:MAG: hypothetical protein ACI4HM_01870 [Ruminococcus sp.]
MKKIRIKLHNIVLTVIVFLVAFSFLVTLTGCSDEPGENNEFVGAWVEIEDESNVKYFNEDGSAYNLPFSNLHGLTKYRILADESLLITGDYGKDEHIEKATTKEEALNDNDLYYLDGDTLILCEDEYTRKD